MKVLTEKNVFERSLSARPKDKKIDDRPLVSVIIPTYNRADLIGETLESVIAQTYQNWECIVVDDGSTDDTRTVVEKYTAEDARIKYYERPADRPKGGNVCRNIGFELSAGRYINWYDSDDLMLPENLAVKVKLLEESDYDFIVTMSKNFFGRDLERFEDANHGDTELKLNLENFATYKIAWITDDIIFSRKTVASIDWNEKLTAGQEYNFICKYLSKKTRGYFEKRVLSLRRMHSGSIRAKRKIEHINNGYLFHARHQTYLELNGELSDKTSFKKCLLRRSVSSYVRLQRDEIVFNSLSLGGSVYRVAGLYGAAVFYSMIISKLVFNRHHRLYRHLIQRLELS